MNNAARNAERTYTGKHTIHEWWGLTWQRIKSCNWLDLAGQFVGEGDLVFDIGANQGVKTWVYRSLGAQVIAVDPLFWVKPDYVPAFRWKFGNDKMVAMVPKAVTETGREDRIEIHVNKFLPYLSSVSRSWRTKSVHKFHYNDRSCVLAKAPTTSLSELIKEFGEPLFLKIDVEGFESHVVAGLDVGVRALSIEFHQDWLHDAIRCMTHLNRLSNGDYEYNYAKNDRGQLALTKWVCSDRLVPYLKTHLVERGPESWGDIYARRRYAS